MTNEELFQDLKQFIDSRLAQELAGVATKEDLKASEERISEKLDHIQDAIAETLTHATETLDASVQDHERRIVKLEQRVA
jgi:hypothetical protein